jgi:TatA/E family protein of Tat protein translocase
LGIDLPEILIILVLALILFGPEKLPDYAAKLGRFVAHMRQASSEVTRPLQQAISQASAPPIPPPTPTQFLTAHFCTQCGHTLEPDFMFCPRCGHRLEEAEKLEKAAKEESSSVEPASKSSEKLQG